MHGLDGDTAFGQRAKIRAVFRLSMRRVAADLVFCQTRFRREELVEVHALALAGDAVSAQAAQRQIGHINIQQGVNRQAVLQDALNYTLRDSCRRAVIDLGMLMIMMRSGQRDCHCRQAVDHTFHGDGDCAGIGQVMSRVWIATQSDGAPETARARIFSSRVICCTLSGVKRVLTWPHIDQLRSGATTLIFPKGCMA